MNIQSEILNLFKGIYEKQEQLSKLTDYELFNEFSNSEVHSLCIIGDNQNVNGAMISSKLAMTRSAISKIISKLKKKELIYSYQNSDNKKEIYYKLTEKGYLIYHKHEKAHKEWEERELKFLNQISDSKMEVISEFLNRYNSYLEDTIVERSNNYDNRFNNENK